MSDASDPQRSAVERVVEARHRRASSWLREPQGDLTQITTRVLRRDGTFEVYRLVAGAKGKVEVIEEVQP